MTDMRPATREEVLLALSYSLRFNRTGKPTRRYSEMMARHTAEALADMLDNTGMVLMMKPPARAPDVQGAHVAGAGRLKP